MPSTRFRVSHFLARIPGGGPINNSFSNVSFADVLSMRSSHYLFLAAKRAPTRKGGDSLWLWFLGSDKDDEAWMLLEHATVLRLVQGPFHQLPLGNPIRSTCRRSSSPQISSFLDVKTVAYTRIQRRVLPDLSPTEQAGVDSLRSQAARARTSCRV